MFVNCSNHRVENWCNDQLEAAKVYGEIVDYIFPMVDARASKEDVSKLAENVCRDIIAIHPDVVMCQGEFTLCFAIVNILKNAGIKVVAGCSNRKAVDHMNEDGTITKVAEYKFEKFREY